MLWHVEGTSMSLMGSIHVLRCDQYELYPEAERIYRSAQRVTFESNFDIAPDNRFLENSLENPLSRKVLPTAFSSAAREWDDLGLAPELLERFQPWRAAMKIALAKAEQRGIRRDCGVDHTLWLRTKQDGKIRSTLEDTNEAVKALSDFPPDEASSFLNYATNPPDAFQNELDTMITAYYDHDDLAFERILDHRLKMWPVGFTKIGIDRNEAWLPTLVQLASDNIPTLVVVGALHCVGSNGLPKLMVNLNYRLIRIV